MRVPSPSSGRTHRCRRDTQSQAFGRELPNHAPPAGTERNPDCDLPLTSEAAGEHQVRQRAGHQGNARRGLYGNRLLGFYRIALMPRKHHAYTRSVMRATKAILKWLDGTVTTTHIDDTMPSTLVRPHPADGRFGKFKAADNVVEKSGDVYDIYYEVEANPGERLTDA